MVHASGHADARADTHSSMRQSVTRDAQHASFTREVSVTDANRCAGAIIIRLLTLYRPFFSVVFRDIA